MPTPYSWPLLSPPAPSPLPGPESVTTFGELLGLGSQPRRGVLRPFRRDRVNDFAAGEGAELIASELGQILGTECSSDFTEGELPWRPEFGSLVYLLRHKNNDEVTREMARAYVLESVGRWHPTARVTKVEVTAGEGLDGLSTMKIQVFFEVRARGNGDLLGRGSTSVALPAVSR